MDDAIDSYLRRFRAAGLDGSACSPGEVEQLARDARVSLPAAYKAYLLIAGREPPSDWVGSDCTIDYLPKLRAGAEELLCECGQPSLPTQAFVFWMHQGYQFLYFLADGGTDDPPVFYYLEGQPGSIQKFERFSDLMLMPGDEEPDA